MDKEREGREKSAIARLLIFSFILPLSPIIKTLIERDCIPTPTQERGTVIVAVYRSEEHRKQ